ncbi:hypothetical protein SanaruYs_05660 [Chryseotalea sanaruensis]|uniref:HTH cro/C1-type domain-containing protein n=2 Tax=Chryseotalea sanaruensis TaxID=2482724 RepID=A0A401U606_9BACT|nr:hypothetical protein SanaruYs_05660 [Chryseotalea sanaruensis]
MTKLAQLVGISQAQISYYERDLQSPGFDVMMKLIKVLETTPEYLAFGESSELDEAIAKVKSLPEKEQSLVLQFLNWRIALETSHTN